MKILQVLSGGGWGGGAVVVLAITRALIARGDRVWVLCLDDQVARRFQAAGASIVRSLFWFRAINPLDAVALAQLIALCLRQRFDLVDTHTSKGGFLGRLAARVAGVPHIVHHAHGFSFNQVTGASRRFYIALERLAARAGHFTISVSEEHRLTALEAGIEPPEKISTILNGIDLKPFAAVDRAAARRALGFDSKDLIIGAVGRLSAQKGFEYLIRALPAVLQAVPAARLAIAGDGPLEIELRQLAFHCGVQDRVRFLGFRKDIPQLLAAFDVFALPSLWEGLSISLMEAMATGKAIVATDIWGNREMVDPEKTGLLAPPANPAALAAALRRVLLDRPLAQALQQNARQAALLRYSEQRMVEQTLALYDGLAQPQPRTAHAAGSSFEQSLIER